MNLTRSNLHAVIGKDGAAILDIEHGLISELNSTGAYVWQRLEHGETPETIVASLVRESSENALVIRRDVSEFLKTLEENHLLRD